MVKHYYCHPNESPMRRFSPWCSEQGLFLPWWVEEWVSGGLFEITSICLNDCLDFIALGEVVLVTLLGFKNKLKKLCLFPCLARCNL